MARGGVEWRRRGRGARAADDEEKLKQGLLAVGHSGGAARPGMAAEQGRAGLELRVARQVGIGSEMLRVSWKRESNGGEVGVEEGAWLA